MKKRMASMILTLMITIGAVTGCAGPDTSNTEKGTPAKASLIQTDNEAEETAERETAPKYVFLFIGDGMSYPQIQLANYYLNASSEEKQKNDILSSSNQLAMMDFPVSGSAQTYNSSSFIPDSASTATAIASGNKTSASRLNVSEDGLKSYATIAEKLKAQKDFKIGILSTVNLNHATPAAFYTHQESRSSYYEIGLELLDSGFDYFAGGALRKPAGSDKSQEDLYGLAEKAGYKVVKTQAEAEALAAGEKKVIVIDEHLADSSSMAYELDREEGEWALADHVEKAIEVLDNESGFFLMAEGGKIDWACHDNDAASAVADMMALDRAVEKAVEFYQEHPGETLILVTGDHETGGLTLGYAATGYSTALQNLQNQKISGAKFDSDYVSAYKEQKTDFDTVMEDVTRLFGLQPPAGDQKEAPQQRDSEDSHPESEEKGSLVLSSYEYDQLREAYEMTMARTGEEKEFGQEEYLKYGSKEPLTVTITHLLNNKSGIHFSSYAHTALPTAVFAQGAGAEQFAGYYDNTEIFKKMADLLHVEY